MVTKIRPVILLYMYFNWVNIVQVGEAIEIEDNQRKSALLVCITYKMRLCAFFMSKDLYYAKKG